MFFVTHLTANTQRHTIVLKNGIFDDGGHSKFFFFLNHIYESTKVNIHFNHIDPALPDSETSELKIPILS